MDEVKTQIIETLPPPDKTESDIYKDQFGAILKMYSIAYTIKSPYLQVGDVTPFNQWLLYVSALTVDSAKMIHIVVPILMAHNVPFKVYQNKEYVDRNNGIWYGKFEAGKILTIICDPKKINQLIREIDPVTDHLRGQVVGNALRVGKILYINFCKKEETDEKKEELTPVKYIIPKGKLPFKVQEKYRVKRRNGIIGRHYIPYRLISFNPKGDIILGIQIKNFNIQHCLIKQARADVFTDNHGRQSIHRLFWQKKVIEDIQDSVNVPRIIDLCRKGNDYYLITEYLEGKSLASLIKDEYGDKKLFELDIMVQVKMFNYFITVLDTVRRIHELGYIHRDLQIDNFIISNGTVYIIDFELAYSMKDKMPNPVYTLGTAGFISPQQTNGEPPDFDDDIYSLGCVLAFMILNPKTPDEFDDKSIENLSNSGLPKNIVTLINSSRSIEKSNRPSIKQMIDILAPVIKNYK